MGERVTCSRRIEWDSMHRVPGHDGACRAYHGHRYRAIFTCGGPIGSAGMILDFGVIKSVMGKWIEDNLDHTAILYSGDTDPAVPLIMASNEKFGKPIYFMEKPPTAEHIAEELARIAQRELEPYKIDVLEVMVLETPNCWATWTRINI